MVDVGYKLTSPDRRMRLERLRKSRASEIMKKDSRAMAKIDILLKHLKNL